MLIFNTTFHIISLIIFILLPLFLFTFIFDYILQIKNKFSRPYIAPLTLILSQFALLFFYIETTKYYWDKTEDISYLSIQNPFVFLPYINFIIILIIFFLRNKIKFHLYIIPFIIICFYMLAYLYY